MRYLLAIRFNPFFYFRKLDRRSFFQSNLYKYIANVLLKINNVHFFMLLHENNYKSSSRLLLYFYDQ